MVYNKKIEDFLKKELNNVKILIILFNFIEIKRYRKLNKNNYKYFILIIQHKFKSK